jgi:hypothetical protein
VVGGFFFAAAVGVLLANRARQDSSASRPKPKRNLTRLLSRLSRPFDREHADDAQGKILDFMEREG